jgi:hypothetical protein
MRELDAGAAGSRWVESGIDLMRESAAPAHLRSLPLARDATQRSCYRARYYDSSSGRFLSEDPARSSSNFYPYVRNNSVNGTDPRGLWDTYTHHALIWNAFRTCNVSNYDIWMLQQESDFVDLDQFPSDAYKHAMKAPLQSASAAIEARENWVNDNLYWAAKQFGDYGDTSGVDNPTNSWTTPFGDALHTIMDMSSPAHMKNGIPISWPAWGNWNKHGDEKESIETWANMTPELMRQTVNAMRRAYVKVTGQKCECSQ